MVRWMVEKQSANHEREVLKTIIIYPQGATTEQIRKENLGVKHERKLLTINS